MKLAATSLVTCLSFTLVTSSPTPVPRDITTATTTKTTWLVSKRAPTSWNPPGTLARRASAAEPSTTTGATSFRRHLTSITTTKPAVPVFKRTIAPRMLARLWPKAGPKPSAGASERQPLYQPTGKEKFANANTNSDEATKIGWMANSKMQWSGDLPTKKWAANANADKKFDWLKNKCANNLSDRGCKSATIGMRPYPPGRGTESHYAEVFDMNPKPKFEGKEADRVTISPDGYVMPTKFADKPGSPQPAGYTPPKPTA